jgi:hypothetical protein
MAKGRCLFLVLFSSLSLGVTSGYSGISGANVLGGDQPSYQNAPNHDTPLILQDLWLKFHEQNLCQKIDAAFIFPKGKGGKLKIWVDAQNQKNYSKFLEWLKPLKDIYQINPHTVRIPSQKASADITTPPPSLFENSDLTAFLRDSFLRNANPFDRGSQFFSSGPLFSPMTVDHRSGERYRIDPLPTAPSPFSIMYEQRLLVFAKETLKYNRAVDQYAEDLPSLVHVAFDPAEAPALRHRALAICRKHVRKLQEYEKKLNKNLSIALTDIDGKPYKGALPKKPITAKTSPFDAALLLAGEAKHLSNSVYSFIYPKDFTVSLADLERPPLIQSLAKIREITAEFRSIID